MVSVVKLQYETPMNHTNVATYICQSVTNKHRNNISFLTTCIGVVFDQSATNKNSGYISLQY